jgi:zinc and cadmium transporter
MQPIDPFILILVMLSVTIVSTISLIGVITFAIDIKKLKKTLQYIVSFAAGSLIGGAFIHLIPEAFNVSGGVFLQVSISILAGIVMFFVLEKLIQWRHCHVPTTEDHPHSFAYMNLVGDGVHNFIDGLIIAGAFLLDVNLGIVTTIAVILHEIPQEIGDFGVLVYGGFKVKKAILLNLATAFTAIIGAVTALAMSSIILNISSFLVPFAAGGFIYIGASDLIPELNRQTNKREASFKVSMGQLVSLVLGLILMTLLLFIG